jgi:glycosyltransferase involved in cell wall biosynthesis
MAAVLPRTSIAVFAHNEQDNIESCLDSVLADWTSRPPTVHVLANGCTDRTELVVAAYAARHPSVRLHRIELGDKANAWNEYIHSFSSPAAVHVFVDGDVQVRPGALSALVRAICEDPSANAATALPDSGRGYGRWLKEIIEEHNLAGNLYALSGSFVERVRAGCIRLPVGLIGDDSWVGALAMFDLDVARRWVKERVIVCTDARFHYDSLQWYRLRDLRLYWRRRIRYAHRHWQNVVMKKRIHEHNVQSLPPHVNQLFRADPEALTLGWMGLDTFFLWLARERIRQSLRT